MQEIAPGIFHWTAFRETIRQHVHSYYVQEAAVVIDPMQPDEGLDWFAERTPPQRALLTNRHHYRHCDRFAERFGLDVLCHSSGLHEFEDGRDVRGFDWGDEVAPGITAHEVGAICPDESALHIQHGGGALAVADGVVRWEGPDAQLGFVPDFLLGDDPEGVRDGLSAAYKRLADELEFDCLLMAHGNPVVGGARETLREFAEG
ncbi:MAG TPA: hypothetical protein VJU60_00140 [Thermoleophilaceae bacterium]|nr:hypothetical protein [Thermoleophilaceae bacterium]